MHFDTLTALTPEADRAEEMIPSLSYRELVESLGFLAGVGVLQDGSLPTMLVVARLMDRRRILQAGMTADELRYALQSYRRVSEGKTSRAVESALQQAVEMASRIH